MTKAGTSKVFFDKDLMNYVDGKKIQRGRPWRTCKRLYILVNVAKLHWVALVVDLQRCSLVVLDSHLSATMTKTMGEVILPYCSMIPLMLKQSGQFKHLGENFTRKWMWTRTKDLCEQTMEGGNCGVYMLKLMELHIMNLSMKGVITDATMVYHRSRYAVEIFKQGMDP
ncbi:hypothetical protein UlMin_018603 [Ulmus minor]